MRNKIVVQGVLAASFLTGAVAGVLAMPATDGAAYASNSDGGSAADGAAYTTGTLGEVGAAALEDQSPAQATPSGRLSSCKGVVTQTLSTSAVRWCEEAQVVARVAPVCSVCPGGLNVLFVLMQSTHEPNWQRAESIRTLEVLQRWEDDPDLDAEVRVGVVRYDYLGGNAMVQLTDNLNSARGAFGTGVPVTGCFGEGCECFPVMGHLQPAIGDVMDMLRRTHEASGLGDDDKTCDYVVLFNEGTFGMCHGYPMQQYATRAIRAAQGMERDVGPLLVGCPSTNDADCEGPRQIPRNRTYFAQANELGVLGEALDRELERLASPHLVRRLTLTERIPSGLALVPASASEPPTDMVTTTEGVDLIWEWEQLQAEVPHEVTFRVAPSVEESPTGTFTVTGSLLIQDRENRNRYVPMPDTALEITGSCVPPTPTPTATSTATETPSPTPTATSTATPRPGRLFLPIAIRERCDKQERSVDAVLVIDASTSMLEGAGGGRTKLEAALAAARTFLDQLDLEGKDQAAIVSFNATASVMQALTHDRAALESALGSITPATQTCLVCAVETGEAALGSDPGSLRTRTMILLTDGRSNPRPAQEAVDRATGAKERGVVIFTVGIGSELDVDALRQIASDEDYFFQSADAADLERIYLEIDRLIPCAATFWPQ